MRTCEMDRTTGPTSRTALQFARRPRHRSRSPPTAASAWESAGGTTRHDVPELPGHARREARDPGPRAAAVRDARGEPIEGGWQTEAVKDALDLCLACKGCKGDCPVNVDMATYKAEFLAHYYEGRPASSGRTRSD